MSKPINRTCVKVDNKYRLYHVDGPINYKKSDGTFEEIDHTFNDTTSSIGDISLMNKGVVSVGKRKGNNPTKVVGIRPDINQHLGTQQLEFSLIGVEVDGVSKSFNVETDLEIKLTAGDVQQLVQINPSSSIFNNCKVEFDIHSTGLELLNQKYSSTTTVRDYGFNITNEGQYSGSNISNFAYANNGNLEKTIPYIDCYVGQIVDDYIVKGDKTDEEELDGEYRDGKEPSFDHQRWLHFFHEYSTPGHNIYIEQSFQNFLARVTHK